MICQALCDFRDLEDGHLYRAGEPFPHDGRTVDQMRIKELSGSVNKAGKPLIFVNETKESAEAKPPKTSRRSKAKE